MIKKIMLVACLIPTIGLSAMEDQQDQPDTKGSYTIISSSTVCTDEQNKQLHALFSGVDNLSLDELKDCCANLKSKDIDCTTAINRSTRSTLLHTLVAAKASLEKVAYFIEEAGYQKGFLIAEFRNKDGKTVLQLAQELEPQNDALITLLEKESEGIRTFMKYGSKAVSSTRYLAIIGLLFGCYKLHHYITSKK